MGLIGGLFQKDVVWTLTSLDTGAYIEGQFKPNNLVENVAGVWAEQGTVGMEQPIIQFVRGALDTIEFDAKVWANHQGLLGTGLGGEDIQPMVDAIRELPRVDPALQRPHVWQFTYTDQFTQTVVVNSVGGIRYDQARPEAFFGLVPSSLRGVMFRISMSRYVENKTADLIGASESLIIYVKEGDTYEIIAKRIYGDARLGEVLRRRNPSMRAPVSGNRLHIPPKATARRELSLKMASLPLKPAERQIALFQATLAKRSVPKRTRLFKMDV